jgi:hypothetical protein
LAVRPRFREWTVGDKVEAAYRWGDGFRKRRLLAQEWANYCGEPVVRTEDNVVALRGATM